MRASRRCSALPSGTHSFKMRHPRPSRRWGCSPEDIATTIIIVIRSLSVLFIVADGQQQPNTLPVVVVVTPLEACRDFGTGGAPFPGLASPSFSLSSLSSSLSSSSLSLSSSSSSSSSSLSSSLTSISPWTLEDCVAVWSQFVDTIPPGQQHQRLRFVDLWRETAAELRRAGSPCLVHANPGDDGLGSSTMKLLASWVFAEEMGCDWVTPDWGKRRVALEGEGEGAGGGGGGNGTASAVVVYCHTTATFEELESLALSSDVQDRHRCAVVDWLAYFRFDVPSVDLPERGRLKLIQIDLRSAEVIEPIAKSLDSGGGIVNQGWDRVVFAIDPSFATLHLSSVGNWDESKRRAARKVLREARDNFHVHPRPWYDGSPKCAYDAARLNIALHVRMGDRRAFQQGSLQYFQYLESFMDIVSTEVTGMGLEPPIFHVFSETVLPCPSAHAGLFDEFWTWPVELDQIPACLSAKTPDDCPAKQAGKFCSPDRSGIFRVVGTKAAIVLHVGHDVQNAMSCMIQADGLLMGCSTFGQVAGLLTRGISFFSQHCSGQMTPAQYKVIPPLAIAERGRMWVPVEGSWRDPVLASMGPLRGALRTLLKIRGTWTE